MPAFRSPPRIIGAPRANRSSTNPAFSSCAGAAAWIGVDVPDGELDAELAVAQAHELGDPGLAAQPAVRSFSCTRRAETSRRSGP